MNILDLLALSLLLLRGTGKLDGWSDCASAEAFHPDKFWFGPSKVSELCLTSISRLHVPFATLLDQRASLSVLDKRHIPKTNYAILGNCL